MTKKRKPQKNKVIIKPTDKPVVINEIITGFKPTLQQLQWLEKALDPTVQPTITAIGKACNVNRENWYVWIKNAEFVKWFNEQWEHGMQETQWFFDKIGMVQAAKDYRYFEAMQMKYHKFARKEDVAPKGSGLYDILKSIDGRTKGLEGDQDEVI